MIEFLERITHDVLAAIYQWITGHNGWPPY